MSPIMSSRHLFHAGYRKLCGGILVFQMKNKSVARRPDYMAFRVPEGGRFWRSSSYRPAISSTSPLFEMSAMEPDTEGTRLLVRDGVLREDERGQLTVYLCDECATLNAGYGTCPYCSDASSCVVVRTAEGTLLTMARPLADSLGIAPMRLGECRCCNEAAARPALGPHMRAWRRCDAPRNIERAARRPHAYPLRRASNHELGTARWPATRRRRARPLCWPPHRQPADGLRYSLSAATAAPLKRLTDWRNRG